MVLSTNKNLFFLLLLILCSSSFLISASESQAGEVHFRYKEGKEGPKHWGELKAEWEVCGKGKSQSPIDIRSIKVVKSPELGKLEKDYKPIPAVLKNGGHDVMIKFSGDAAKININGTDYNVIQCHWHVPSENTLDGEKFDLELHLVHQSSQGVKAVIGIWYKIGKPDSFLTKLLDHIKAMGDKEVDLGEINPDDISFDSKEYYRFIGSLTTPPCTEGVIWTIVKKPRTVSIEQIEALKAAVAPEYVKNARPTQNLYDRQVLLYSQNADEL